MIRLIILVLPDPVASWPPSLVHGSRCDQHLDFGQGYRSSVRRMPRTSYR